MAYSECNMGMRKYIELTKTGNTGHILLNRPEVHNALNIEMIRELSLLLDDLENNEDIRLIRIAGAGQHFSSGADLKWMKEVQDQTHDQLRSESRELALLFNKLYNSKKITITIATGKVVGGAIGLLAATDITLASEDTLFTFSEVKLGLVPATIFPYIVLRSGESAAKEWMLSGREISADEAFIKGLIQVKYPEPVFDREIENYSNHLLQNGPEAMKGIKSLYRKYPSEMNPDLLIDETAEMISKYRISEEGMEGMRAFFEKRNPAWRNDG